MSWRVLATLAVAASMLSGHPIPAHADAPTTEEVEKAQKRTDEIVSSIQSLLTRLQRTQVTGYVQGRGLYSHNGLPKSNLFVRRARLNLRHTGDAGGFALSFDGGQNSVTVKDAYADWAITKARGQRAGIVLRAGQFFRPFGYEVERSATVREFLERPVAWGVLFPGNRDQGFNLSVGVTPALVADFAVVNGGGTSTTALSFRDADDRKDLVARVRYSFFAPRADLALSFYDGEQTIAGTAAVAATNGFVDSNGNGVKDEGEPSVVISPAKAAVPAIHGSRDRVGAALNLYNLAGGTLRAEWIEARDLTTNLTTTGGRLREADVRTWYAQYTRALPRDFAVGLRYDLFDPDSDDEIRLDGDGEQRTLDLVCSRTWGDFITISALWEHQEIDTYKKPIKKSDRSINDPLTVQVQYVF